jgi:hypothetical protein
MPPGKLSPTLWTCRTGRVIERGWGRKGSTKRIKFFVGVSVILATRDTVDAARCEASYDNSEKPNEADGNKRVYT